MKFVQLFTISLLAICLSLNATAQKGVQKADDEFKNLAYVDAAKLYKVAEPTVKSLDDKARIFFQIGECYRLVADNTSSLEWYEKAVTAQYYNVNPEVYYNYGISLQKLERFDDATAAFNKYIAKGGEKSKANASIASCKTAAEKKAAKTKLIVENMAELNSPFFDYALNFSSKKGDQIIFSSSRQAATGSGADPITGESFVDLFFADQDKKGKWSAPQLVAGDVNTVSNEGAGTFNKDYSEFYYTQCRVDGKDRFGCDILRAKKGANSYTDVKNLNILDRNENDTSVVGHPAISPDEKFLIFASDMTGGKGGKDLWYITYDKKNDSWGKPSNLSALNSKGDDMFPYVSEDGTLYYSSDGQGGLGGLDIFKAEKTGDMAFGPGAPMDYPINSSANDFAIVLDGKKDGDKRMSGFFTSNRPGGKGKDDLYRFSEPPLEFGLIGTAYDKDTGSPIAGANVIISGSDGANFTLTSDGNGGFSLDKSQVKGNVTYNVDVQKEKHIGTGDKFSTVGLTSSTTFAREYFLIPIADISKEYEMPLVLYPYDQSILLIDAEVNSADSLNYLLDILQKNPKLKIQLEAHTDARGKDDYNQKLSEARAKTCVDYLISKGIASDRMVPVGMGEKQPRKLVKDVGGFKAATLMTEAFINKLPKEQQEAAHLLNRRTIFKVIDFNYVPKN